MFRRFLVPFILFFPATANATDVSVKLEPGVAVPLTAPQSQRFDTGGAASVKVLFGLNRYVDIGPATSFMLLPGSKPGVESGTAWTFGGGLRLKRPHDRASAYGISPWLDADHRNKLELKEKFQFAWNTPKLEDVSFPLLDEVAQEGHSSSEGTDDHNQMLSDQRASAVLDYLVAHGVAKERLGSKGFSSSVPIDTNRTPAGRENNRRVEFVVTLNIVNVSGSSK